MRMILISMSISHFCHFCFRVAVGARALPRPEAGRIVQVPSWDQKQEVLRGGPKRVDCCGSLSAWNDLETFLTPALERALRPWASHLTERHTSKRPLCADV